MSDEEKKRVNKGYHYVRYGLFGFFLIFLTKMVEWRASGLLPRLWIAVLAVIVTGLVILMDGRNQKLWRQNEKYENGPDPGRPVITLFLIPFYVACLIGLLFLLFRSPPLISAHATLQQQFGESVPRPVEAALNTQITLVQREIDTLVAERQTLAEKIKQDQSAMAELANQRQQLKVEIEQRQQALAELSVQSEKAVSEAADKAKVVEAQQRQLEEQRVAIETQQREVAALQQSVNRERAVADQEAAGLTQRTQALAQQGWTFALNKAAAITVVVLGIFLVIVPAAWVYARYYR
jgi:hypothetical protein